MVYLYTVKLSLGDAYAGLLKFFHAELKMIQSLLKAKRAPCPMHAGQAQGQAPSC